jgi:FAD:protein FMN transferase
VKNLLTRLTAWTLLALIGACATTPQPTVLHGDGLGSTWTVKLGAGAAGDLAEIQRGIQARLDEVSRHISRWDEASEMSVLNVSARNDWQPASDGLLEALEYAFALAADTGGAFDPTVAPLVDAWGFGKAGRRFEPPSPEALSAARSRVGFDRVALDTAGHRVRKPAGMQIDLSSMQHGRGADAVAEYLNSLGIHDYLVDVGSEIRAHGKSPEGAAWHVAVERPSAPDATTPATTEGFEHVVVLRDAGIATSGNFRYFFDYNGRRYSHRIDPRTGEPVSHALVSVTVIDPVCMHADALATALTVLGPEEGFEYAAHRNIAALFISKSGAGLIERMTPQFASYLN